MQHELIRKTGNGKRKEQPNRNAQSIIKNIKSTKI